MTRKVISDRLLSDEASAFLADLGEDVLWRVTRLAQGGFDLAVLVALGMIIYMTGIDSASASMQGKPMFGVQARAEMSAGGMLKASHAPTSCGLNNDLLASPNRSCTHALILQPADI